MNSRLYVYSTAFKAIELHQTETIIHSHHWQQAICVAWLPSVTASP